MTEKKIINLLEQTLTTSLDILEPIKISQADIKDIEYLYREIGKSLDRNLGTNIGPSRFTVGQI